MMKQLASVETTGWSNVVIVFLLLFVPFDVLSYSIDHSADGGSGAAVSEKSLVREKYNYHSRIHPAYTYT